MLRRHRPQAVELIHDRADQQLNLDRPKSPAANPGVTSGREDTKDRLFYHCHAPCDGVFASVWNALAGRSTTKAEDVPLIIANILHMNSGQLLKYRRPEQMYQAILLNRNGRVPLSLFSNTGPRYFAEGQNLNRWLPAGVSKNLLASKEYFYPHRGKCLLLLSQARGENDIGIFTLHGRDLRQLEPFVKFTNSSTVYTVEPSDLYATEAESDGFTATCIILEEDDDLLTWPPVKRGSCFTIARSFTGPTYRHPPKHLTYELIFRGPLRFHEIVDARYTAQNTLTLGAVEGLVELRVLYGTSTSLHYLLWSRC